MPAPPPNPALRPTVLLLFAGMLTLSGGVVVIGANIGSDVVLNGGLQLCSTVIGAAATIALTLSKAN